MELLSKDWEQSGLTQREFCSQRGVDFKKFSNWRQRNPLACNRSQSSSAITVPKNLLPVEVVDDQPEGKATAQQSLDRAGCGSITLTTPSGYTIHLEDDFKSNVLFRLLKTLKEIA